MAGMRYQPQGLVRLNTGHPLARALSFAWIASAPDINLVTRKAATTQGTAPAKLPYIDRLGRKFIGTGSIDFGNTPETSFSGLSQQTVFAEIFMPDTAISDGFVLGRVQGSWDYHIQVTTQQLGYACGGDSVSVVYPAASVVGGLLPFQGRPVPICGTYDKITQRLYVDGALKNTKANTGSFATGADAFGIGARGGGGQTSATGVYVGIVLIFKRVLSDAEVLSISQNPWQLFDDGEEFDAVAVAGGTVSDDGTLSWSESSDSIVIGTFVTDSVSISWIESGDVYNIPLVFTDRVSVSYTEDADAYAVNVTQSGGPSSLAWTESSDAYTLSGNVTDAATVSWVETSDGLTIPLLVNNLGAPTWMEDSDAVSILGFCTDFGTLSWTETNDGVLFLQGTSTLGSMRRRKGIHK